MLTAEKIRVDADTYFVILENELLNVSPNVFPNLPACCAAIVTLLNSFSIPFNCVVVKVPDADILFNFDRSVSMDAPKSFVAFELFCIHTDILLSRVFTCKLEAIILDSADTEVRLFFTRDNSVLNSV